MMIAKTHTWLKYKHRKVLQNFTLTYFYSERFISLQMPLEVLHFRIWVLHAWT